MWAANKTAKNIPRFRVLGFMAITTSIAAAVANCHQEIHSICTWWPLPSLDQGSYWSTWWSLLPSFICQGSHRSTWSLSPPHVKVHKTLSPQHIAFEVLFKSLGRRSCNLLMKFTCFFFFFSQSRNWYSLPPPPSDQICCCSTAIYTKLLLQAPNFGFWVGSKHLSDFFSIVLIGGFEHSGKEK